MEYIAQAKDYWIAPQAVKITLNALGNPHRTQATVASGAVIMCYIKGVDGLEYDNGHQYRAWNISASPTYFNTATKKYVYAAIPRSSEVGVQAVIVYPSEMLDIYGYNEDGDQIGSEHFYYIWLQGVISESAYNRANRYWLDDIDYGILATDEARDDQSYNTDWYTFNAVTQTVTFLKEIIMKAGSSFRNLILGEHNLTGVATGDTPEDIDSDTLVVTPNYIRNKFLHKDRDDATPYSLTIEQELRVGNRGIMNHLQSTDYTGDGMLDSGYKLWYEEGRAKLVIDDLVARGKFTVNELETRIWTYAGGNMVFSGAGSTIFFVEYLDANENPLGYTYINQPWLLRGRALLAASLSWSKRRQIQRQLSDTERAQVVKFRCYEYSDDGTMQTRNWWHTNDIAMCQSLNKVRDKVNADGSYSGALSNTVYKRRIAGIGSKEIPMLNDGRIYDYVDMWNIYDVYGQTYINSQGQTVTITDSVKGFQNMAPSGATPSTDWPAAGDVIVQMGNPLDTDRQAAVTIEVQGDVHGFKVYDTISDYSMENKLWVEIGYDQTTSKAKANVYGDFRFGCRENEEAQGGSYIKYNRTTKQLDIRANVRFTSPTTHQDTTLDNFASAVVGELGELQNQIDGEIDTWFYNGEPGPTVLPESEWVAADTQAGNNNERLKHLGDLYYDNSSGYAYRYSNSGTEQSPVFYWNPISDSAVIKALEDAAKAQDTADHKRRVFTAQPAPPYDAGDLWVNVTYPANYTGETDESQHKYKNEILKCITSKPLDTDTFSINDWSLSNGYTSKLNNFVTNTYAPFAQNIQTQVDKKAETYRQATNPASSWAEADKPSHVGDIWMDISANGGKKTYIYQNTAAAGQTPVYDWVAQEVPDEVFDEIDGKTAIYVGWNDWVVDNVSQLNDKDLFIPAADVTPTGSSVTYYANKVYRWDATNSTWNEVAYTDDTYAHNFDYLKTAMKGITEIQGGLLLSSAIVLKDLDTTTTPATPTNIMAGMNGILNTDLTNPKKSIAAWYGGDMVDLEDLTHYWTAQQIAAWEALTPEQKAASVLVAKSLDRFDGSGYRASGNISWNAAGDLTIKGQVVTATTKIDTPAIFLNGTDITSTLNAILGMFEIQTINNVEWVHVKNNRPFYSDSDISAGGAASGGGGGGGASVLYELNDVTPNAAGNEVMGIVITDGQTTAGDGYVLTFDGSTKKWKAAPTAGTYVLPQATSGALGGVKIGFTESGKNYAVQLDNSGKAYVNVPWTDTTYDLSGYLQKSGGTMTGALTINPSNTSSFQDGIILNDNGGGASEALTIKWTSASYTTGVKLSADLASNYLIFHDGTAWRTVYHSGNNPFVIRRELSDAYINGTTYSTLDNGTYLHAYTGASEAIIHFQRSNCSASGLDIRFKFPQDSSNPLQYRKCIDSNRFASTDWVTLIDSLNIGDQTVAAATKASQDGSGTTIRGNYLRKVTAPNNAANDFNDFDNMTLTGRGDPATGASVVHSPWTGAGPAGGYGALTYLWSNYGIQMAWGYNSDRVYIRNKNYKNGSYTWNTSWSQLALTSDFASMTDSIIPDTDKAIDLGSSTKRWRYIYSYGIWGKSGAELRLGGNDATLMYLTSDAKCGIGTDSPSQKLHVSGGLLAITNNNRTVTIGAQNNGAIHIYNDNNSGTYFNGDVCCNSANTYDLGSTTYPWGALYAAQCYIYATSPSVHVGTSSSARISLHWSSDNNRGLYDYSGYWVIGAKTNTFLMRGNVGIGTTSPSYKLHVSGAIYATGDITAASDQRAKCDIEQVDLSVEQIANAPAIKFSWKDGRDNLRHVGSFAQYWQKVLPESVTDKNDILGLNYGSAALVSVVKVAKKVLTHEEEIEQLRKRVRELEHEVEQLKSA